MSAREKKRKEQPHQRSDDDDDDDDDDGVDFWADLDRDMKEARALDPETFWNRFQGRVPLTEEINWPASLTSSTSAASTATTSSAAALTPGVVESKNRIERIVTTEEYIADASSEEIRAAIEEINNRIVQNNNKQGKRRWWQLWPATGTGTGKEITQKYKNRLLSLEIAAQLTKRLEETEKRAEEEKKEKKIDKRGIMAWVDSTAKSKQIVCNALELLGNMSAETEQTFAQNTVAAKEEKKKRTEVDERPVGDRFVKQLNPNASRDKLVKSVSALKEFSGLHFKSVVPGNDRTDGIAVNNLQAVAKVYQTLFRQACFLRREDDREGNAEFYKKLLQKAVTVLVDAATKIREGVMDQDVLNQLVTKIEIENNDLELVKVVEHLQQLRSWLQGENRTNDSKPIINNVPAKVKEVFDAIDKKQKREDKVRVINEHLNDLMLALMWLPGPTAQEVHGCQVVFEALLGAISDCLPNNAPASPNRLTPLKGTARGERRNAATTGRQGQFADFTLFKRGRYRVCIHDDTFEMCIEIKPYQRLVSGPNECQIEALNQGLSHVAEVLYPAVELGPGFPAHAIFVVGTVLHVQVYKLVLKDPGTRDAKLELEASKYLPLLPQDCYKRYIESDSRHKDDSSVFCRKLYDQPDTNENDKETAGIAALAKLMRSSQGSLIRLDHPSLKVAQLLGSGTFGLVLDIGNCHVLKLSRCGNRSDLAYEVAILKFLGGSKDEDAARVVSLKSYGMLKIPYRGISVELPGLLLSPKGNQPETMKESEFSQVATDLLCGLKWLHGRGITHNDMSGTNFVLYNGHAVITDLACASLLNTMMRRFLGTPDFAHPDIHAGFWIARKVYDIAALAHTLCTLDNGGITPWYPIAEPCKSSDNPKLEDRHYKTLKWLDGANLDEDARKQLLVSVSFSEPLRKCKRQKSECSSNCKCTVCTTECKCHGECHKSRKPAPVIVLPTILFDEPLNLNIMSTVDDNN